MSRADLAIVHCIALVGTDGPVVRFLGDATIEITGNRITRITSGASTDAHEVIDADGMVAMPGLINTHAHAAMTLFRGAAEGKIRQSLSFKEADFRQAGDYKVKTIV